MSLLELRQDYHAQICKEIISFKKDGRTAYPNFADKSSKASRKIATLITRQIGCQATYKRISGQSAGNRFEAITQDFLKATFTLLQHLRPGQWHYAVETPIATFDQYEHLAELEATIKQNDTLAAALGSDYIIKPDIVISRYPVCDAEINQQALIIQEMESLASLTPLRAANTPDQRLILHASISCKWTLRSDRSQNARAEALNLIRNRKGNLPHVVAVTAEPLPTRIASLALGTGDLDCVYHFALPELSAAVQQVDNEGQMDMLNILIEGRRLRDISDLPFDLAI